MANVSSPINRRPTDLPLSPGARATQNYHPAGRTDSEPSTSTSQVTAGDKGISRPGSIRRGGTRDDGGLSASQAHIARHRLLQLSREDR
jgi:hypothetical protein